MFVTSVKEIVLADARIRGILVEMFVFMYGQMLWKLPFFGEYSGPAIFLSEMMVQFEPGRASIQLAYWVAMLKAAQHEGIGNIMRKDKIMENIKKHNEAGYPILAIAQDLAEEVG